MKIHFHGAAGTVTGSMHLLEVNGKRILLECGLLQGKRKETFERNRNLPFEPSTIDICILSHAHIDHSGNLPSLVKRGYRGRILVTPPTFDLCGFMLLDSAYLQEKDVYFVNKRRKKQGKSPFEPLYGGEDVHRTLRQMDSIPYEKRTEVAPGVTLTYRDAGHILGSATVILDIEEEKAGKRRLLFTGDLGRKGAPIIADPVPVNDVDLLVIEGTYGDRLHPARSDIKKKLRELCAHILDHNSRLLIPAFAVGRTQQILYHMNELHAEGLLPPIPVYVDSPMASKATEVYENHPEAYDRAAYEQLRKGDHPFSFPRLRFIADVEESKKLNWTKGPSIVISASGMCEGGRILHHLAHGLDNPDNIVLIPGFQAEHTLGRRLVEGATRVSIYGEEVDVRARVVSIRGLSAHADRDGLLEFVGEMGGKIAHAFVVHCEPGPGKALADGMREMGLKEVDVPVLHQTFEL
jgi:metallo-beta-lactamase family protein